MDATPISPRARRLLALERGESDAPTRRMQVRVPTPSVKSSSSRRRRHRPSDSEPLASSPWAELCGAASPTTILQLLAALVALLVVLDVAIESLALAYCPPSASSPSPPNGAWLARLFSSPTETSGPSIKHSDESCSPSVIDLSAFEASRSRHRFYDLLVRRGPPTPPVFTREFQVLCEADVRHQSRFGYCLPIGGRTDEPFCARADRMDLLVPRINATTYCYASVLHMLFGDVYEELLALGADPRVAYGTLLGAVRNRSMISYTEDADIAYTPLAPDEFETLKSRLWSKGFHLFHFTKLWRVCVAPTHPLARELYTPEKGLTRNYKVPYVDLYELKPVDFDDGRYWDLYGTYDDRLIPDDKVDPVTTVEINGLSFRTFADPVDFLVNEYGDDYLTPVARPQKKSNGFNFFDLDEQPKDKEKATEKKNDTDIKASRDGSANTV